MARHRAVGAIGVIAHHALVVGGAVALTLTFFLILPLIQAISEQRRSSTPTHQVETTRLPPPDEPPPPEEEEEEEDEPPPPPEVQVEEQRLDLSLLELALNPGFGGDFAVGDFGVDLRTVGGDSDDMEGLFSMEDLDQPPRPIHQPMPSMNKRMRDRSPGNVLVIFVVDENGRVVNPKVERSSDAVFEAASLAAIRQWRFEPGQRKGKPVQRRMRQSFVFPKSR